MNSLLMFLQTLHIALGHIYTYIYDPRHEKTLLHMRKHMRDNCVADKRFCFRYVDSTIPLLFNMWLYSPVCVGTSRKP